MLNDWADNIVGILAAVLFGIAASVMMVAYIEHRSDAPTGRPRPAALIPVPKLDEVGETVASGSGSEPQQPWAR